MKKTAFLLFLLFVIQTLTYSQTCLPDGLNFTTQAQIDSFPVNFPTCTKIVGNVDINNLDSLIQVTSFERELDLRRC